MKAFLALGVIGVMAWIGFAVSDPIFDAAARNLCSAHAQEHGLELLEAEGIFGYRRMRNWWTPRSAAYWCRFEDKAGQVVFIDELDRTMHVTWESRATRFAGWGAIVLPIVAGVAISGVLGLLKRDG
jgi:hypothetical protein